MDKQALIKVNRLRVSAAFKNTFERTNVSIYVDDTFSVSPLSFKIRGRLVAASNDN